MSVLAAYTQVNMNIPEMEEVLDSFQNCVVSVVAPALPFGKYLKTYIKNEQTKDYILQYLQEADFNISDISTKDRNASAVIISNTVFDIEYKK